MRRRCCAGNPCQIAVVLSVTGSVGSESKLGAIENLSSAFERLVTEVKTWASWLSKAIVQADLFSAEDAILCQTKITIVEECKGLPLVVYSIE